MGSQQTNVDELTKKLDSLSELLSSAGEILSADKIAEKIAPFLNELEKVKGVFSREKVSEAEVEEIRLLFFSRKRGIVSYLYSEIRSLPAEAKPKLGKLAKEIEGIAREIADALSTRAKRKKEEFFDYTLPGANLLMGRLHPTKRALRKIVRIFLSMGFDVCDGPEIEYEKYNFDLLNIPPYHPARDDVDTFFLADKIVLRTHTSPVQIRVMERAKKDGQVIVQMISPGRAFRRDRPDSTHTPMFHQVEGLQVGKGISMANMRWILDEFARRFFGPETRTRLRPDYFPFVEPGAELAVTCPFCQAKGCRVCKQSGWIEVLGCGMVHPQVLRNVGIDPNIYSGWAFGMGVERLAMILYQIPDIRLFFENDMRFLRQF